MHAARRSRFLGAGLAGALLVGVSAVPAFAADTAEDTFESADSPTVVTVDSVTSDAGEWTVLEDYEIEVSVSDANTLAASFLSVAVVVHLNDATFQIGEGLPAGELDPSAASQVIFGAGNPLYDEVIDPWFVMSAGPSWAATPDLDWGATAGSFTADLTIGRVARAASDWKVTAVALDGDFKILDFDTFGSTFEVLPAVTVGDSDAKSFGSIAVGGSATTTGDLEGVLANAPWTLEMQVVDDEWESDFHQVPLAETTVGDLDDLDELGSGFALQCAMGGVGDLRNEGIPIWATQARAIYGAPWAAFDDETPADRTIQCAVYNGATPAGVYSGRVRTSAVLG